MPKKPFNYVDDPKALGERLRAARERAGLSQRALAFPGCTAAYISRTETGQRVPSLQLLRELGRRLDVTAEYLVTGRAEDPVGLDGLDEAELVLRLGELQQAEAQFEAELGATSDPSRQGRALAGLGVIAFNRGELDVAIRHLDEARRLLAEQAIEYPSAIEALGKAHAIRGDFESAIAVFESAATAARERDSIHLSRYEMLLANALIDNGSYTRAGELLAVAIQREEPTSDPLERARLYWSQSRLHLVRGENDLAARYARLTIAAVEQTEYEHYAARARHLVASVALEQGDPEGALEQLMGGLPLIEQAGDRFLNGLFRVEIARALLQLKRPDEAGLFAAQAADLLEGVSRVDMARARLSLAMVLVQTGDEDAALEMFEEIATELVNLKSPLASQAFTAWSNLLSESGDMEGALEVLRRAVRAQAAEPSRE